MSTEDAQPQVNVSIDDLSQNSAIGSLSDAMTNNIYGFNHRQTPLAIFVHYEYGCR